jgi:hypothetical protein
VPKEVRAKRVSAVQSRAYLAKAVEFLDAARDSLEGGRTIAATSLAVHAGINSADAITVARMGQRATGPGHDQAVQLLGQAGPEGKKAAASLRRLLPLKTRAEYDPDDVPKATAARAVSWAEKAVAIARQVVESVPARKL